jgi:hypothetical protein
VRWTALTPEIASSMKWSADSSPSFLKSETTPAGKSEIRISKSETISKSKLSMPQPPQLPTILDFEFQSFEFVSDFGFRASDFLH